MPKPRSFYLVSAACVVLLSLPRHALAQRPLARPYAGVGIGLGWYGWRCEPAFCTGDNTRSVAVSARAGLALGRGRLELGLEGAGWTSSNYQFGTVAGAVTIYPLRPRLFVGAGLGLAIERYFPTFTGQAGSAYSRAANSSLAAIVHAGYEVFAAKHAAVAPYAAYATSLRGLQADWQNAELFHVGVSLRVR